MWQGLYLGLALGDQGMERRAGWGTGKETGVGGALKVVRRPHERVALKQRLEQSEQCLWLPPVTPEHERSYSF